MKYWIIDKKRVLTHLKSDSKRWKKLSSMAFKEYKSDIMLMKKIK